MKTTFTLVFVFMALSSASLFARINQRDQIIRLTDIAGSYQNTIWISSNHNLLGIRNEGTTEESKINGKWIGKVSGPQGDFELTFTFKVDGDTLTGTNSSSMGEVDLTNGVVDGNNFSFDVDVQGMTINHKCKYIADDDTIEVKVEINDQEMVMKLTRVTE
jgi:hypothetical protein